MLLLHGFPEGWASWAKVIPGFLEKVLISISCARTLCHPSIAIALCAWVSLLPKGLSSCGSWLTRLQSLWPPSSSQGCISWVLTPCRCDPQKVLAIAISILADWLKLDYVRYRSTSLLKMWNSFWSSTISAQTANPFSLLTIGYVSHLNMSTISITHFFCLPGYVNRSLDITLFYRFLIGLILFW